MNVFGSGVMSLPSCQETSPSKKERWESEAYLNSGSVIEYSLSPTFCAVKLWHMQYIGWVPVFSFQIQTKTKKKKKERGRIVADF